MLVRLRLRVVRLVRGFHKDSRRPIVPFQAAIPPSLPTPGLIAPDPVVEELGLVPRLAVIRANVYPDNLSAAARVGVAFNTDRRLFTCDSVRSGMRCPVDG